MIVKLGSLISEYSVRNKADEDIPVYSVTNEQGFCTGYFNKEVASQDRSTYKIVPRGCFAYNPSRINVGSVDVQECEDRVIVSPLYVVFSVDEKLNSRYLLHYLKSDITLTYIKAYASGSVRDNLKFSILKDFPINLPSAEEQEQIVATLDGIEHLIALRKEELASLDELVKSRFIELFGDLKSNPHNWQYKNLLDVADIDTVMVSDYEKYADYPHIGIDSIEKNTGRLFGYRTIAEDGVISGKYLFTARHIIYSKIRPNLNKVALPDFEGLCSADAYPILPKENVCLRIYLGYVMRSEFFLDYILPFSRRANMPKVNKEQLSGFNLPVPDIELQRQFAAFVEQTDKSKLCGEMEVAA